MRGVPQGARPVFRAEFIFAEDPKNCAALAEVQPAQPPTTSSTFPGADGGACPAEVAASSEHMLRQPSAWSRLIQS